MCTSGFLNIYWITLCETYLSANHCDAKQYHIFFNPLKYFLSFKFLPVIFQWNTLRIRTILLASPGPYRAQNNSLCRADALLTLSQTILKERVHIIAVQLFPYALLFNIDMFKIQIVLIRNTYIFYSLTVHLHFNSIAKQGKKCVFVSYYKCSQCVLPSLYECYRKNIRTWSSMRVNVSKEKGENALCWKSFFIVSCFLSPHFKDFGYAFIPHESQALTLGQGELAS